MFWLLLVQREQQKYQPLSYEPESFPETLSGVRFEQ